MKLSELEELSISNLTENVKFLLDYKQLSSESKTPSEYISKQLSYDQLFSQLYQDCDMLLIQHDIESIRNNLSVPTSLIQLKITPKNIFVVSAFCENNRGMVDNLKGYNLISAVDDLFTKIEWEEIKGSQNSPFVLSNNICSEIPEETTVGLVVSEKLFADISSGISSVIPSSRLKYTIENELSDNTISDVVSLGTLSIINNLVGLDNIASSFNEFSEVSGYVGTRQTFDDVENYLIKKLNTYKYIRRDDVVNNMEQMLSIFSPKTAQEDKELRRVVNQKIIYELSTDIIPENFISSIDTICSEVSNLLPTSWVANYLGYSDNLVFSGNKNTILCSMVCWGLNSLSGNNECIYPISAQGQQPLRKSFRKKTPFRYDNNFYYIWRDDTKQEISTLSNELSAEGIYSIIEKVSADNYIKYTLSIDSSNSKDISVDGITGEDLSFAALLSDFTGQMIINNKSGTTVYCNNTNIIPVETPRKIFWNVLVKNLENFKNCTIESSPKVYTNYLKNNELPAVSSEIPVLYKIDLDGTPVFINLQVLGYNKSIPERIKYKNGTDIIYVQTIGSGGLLSSITTETSAFSSKTGYDGYLGNVQGCSLEIVSCDGNEINGVSHTYGNNCPYDAPTSLTVGGTEYSFAGWNMTLMSKCGLAAKYNGALYNRSQFNSANRNDWSNSQMRAWMNGSSAVANQEWYSSGGDTTGKITGLLSRFPDEKFLSAVSPCVNRTWVHDDWRSGKTLDSNDCEHVVDKFWLLGGGNINMVSTWMKDYAYDTSKFTGVFTSNNTRIRKYMNEDGSEGDACPWWFRSAHSEYGFYVGEVGKNGGFYWGGGDGNCACLPACIIQ